MHNELIIDAQGECTNIALLQNNKLTELIEDKGDEKFSVGDIYLGKTKKLATGLNAAFVDVGYEKDAFLHYHDLGPQIKSWQSFTKRTFTGKQSWSLTNFKMQPLIDKNGTIDEVLKSGHDMLVQIAKEPISTKGPRITSEISLPGRYLVLVPFSDRVSVSQKVRDRKEKERLKKIISSIKPKGFGVIVRTVAEGQSIEDFELDLKNLMKKWRNLHKYIKRSKSPSRVYGEMNRASAFLRDVFNDTYDKIVVNDQELANEIRDYIETIAPEKKNIVHHFKGKTPIFQYFGIDRQIKSSFGRSVSMPKGSYLIIEHTEAMHVIDVNSGNRTNSGDNQEENALAVNLLAAEEIARQLRLRDMGGIVVIDFIDMHKNENRKILFEKMREVMRQDRAKHKILPPSKFGLVEITRQRVRPESNIQTREENPDNLVEAPLLLIDDIEHAFNRIAKEASEKKLSLHVHPFISAYLTQGFWTNIRKKWQKEYGKKLEVVPRDAYKMLEYHFYNEKNEEYILE
ncbi:MAG: ribonuclease E/G [Schleiferiaceae bacterium]|nr:ribonuclease E/G [Schleiferiaceae bacterium]